MLSGAIPTSRPISSSSASVKPSRDGTRLGRELEDFRNLLLAVSTIAHVSRLVSGTIGEMCRVIAKTSHMLPTLHVRDQPHTSLVREVRIGPLDEHAQPVPKSNQIHNVKREPEHPCKSSREADLPQIVYGA